MNSGRVTPHWREIHEHLVRLSKRRAQLDFEEAEWLVLGEREAVHERLGYGSFVEYLGVVFGYKPREATERIRVARRLARLPAIAAKLSQGALVWSAARELGRVATPQTEAAWLEAAQGKGAKQVETMVSGHKPGDLPSEPKEPAAETHVLRFEVDGATLATWREAVKKVQAEHGGQLTEEQALLAIARIALEGPADAGRSSYQVAVTVCEECGGGSQHGRGELISVPEEVVEMASCDAQYIGSVEVTHVGQNERAKQTVPPARRRHVLHRDHGQCVVDGCRAATFVDVHHLHWRSDGGKHDIDGLVTMCGAHHRAVHAGTLIIEGTPSTGLRFFHADKTSYGSPHVDAEKADRAAELFNELRSMGMRADQAWRAVHP